MSTISIGQVWQNGCAAVKIQGEPGSLQLVLFDMDPQHRLKYKNMFVMAEKEALEFLTGHDCQLTDKKLVAVSA
jgi:hypothetical protein